MSSSGWCLDQFLFRSFLWPLYENLVKKSGIDHWGDQCVLQCPSVSPSMCFTVHPRFPGQPVSERIWSQIISVTCDLQTIYQTKLFAICTTFYCSNMSPMAQVWIRNLQKFQTLAIKVTFNDVSSKTFEEKQHFLRVCILNSQIWQLM